MAEEQMPEPYKTTKELFEQLFNRPKMTQKLLSKPPFKYIFDIIFETMKVTGFAKGLYSDEELKSEYYQGKEQKLTYLKKMIDLCQLMLKEEIPAKPTKIVAGLEPENTNLFLQAVYKAAVTTVVNSEPFVQQILSKQGQQQQSSQQPQQQQQQKQVQQQQQQHHEESKQQKQQLQQQQKSGQEQKQAQEQKQKPPEKKEPKEPIKQPQEFEDQNKAQSQQKFQNQQEEMPKKIYSNEQILQDEEKTKLIQRNQNPQFQMENFNPQQHGKAIREAMQENQEELPASGEDSAQKRENEDEQQNQGPKIKMGKIGGSKKKKKGTEAQGSVATGSGGAIDIESLTKLVQNICQNANPLGKTMEFVQDDIESMNQELEYWKKQYAQSKDKMSIELKTTEEALQPLQDKLAEIDMQIKDQKAKIQNIKTTIIKNQSKITALLFSVVANK